MGGRGGKDNQRIKITEPDRREEKKEEREEREERQQREPTREEIRKMSGAEFREFLIKEEDKFDDKIKGIEEKRNKLLNKLDDLRSSHYDITDAMRNLLKDPDDPSRRRIESQLSESELKEYNRLADEQAKYSVKIDRYSKKENKLFQEINTIKKEHAEERRKWFELNPGEGVSLSIIMPVTSVLQRRVESEFKPQKEFLERIFAKRGTQTIEFRVEGSRGGGGQADWRSRTVTLGTGSVFGTAAVHEYTHMIEHMSRGVVEERHKKVVELFESKFGKPLEEIELRRWVSYVDIEGKKHYGRGTGGDYVLIPKDIQFASPQEESEFGYMFRVYKHQTVEREGKRYIRRMNPSEPYAQGFGLGEEILPKAAELFYSGGARQFAKNYPEFFDLSLNMFRKR